jgi:hypothetical protein
MTATYCDVERRIVEEEARRRVRGKPANGSAYRRSSDPRSRDALGKLHAGYGVAARGRPSSRRFFALTFAGIVSTITS